MNATLRIISKRARTAPMVMLCAVIASGCTTTTHDIDMWVTHDYRCESGATIRAAYRPPDAATVQYGEHVQHMRIAVSASGARYVGDTLEWWTKGSGAGASALLLRHETDGNGPIIERCVQRD